MKLQGYPMTFREYRFPLIMFSSLFFLWGFARSIIDVLNKHLQEAMSISISQSALIQVSCYLAYFLMALPAGFYINRFGYRHGVVTGLLLFAVGALMFIPAANQAIFYLFLAALFVLASGLTFLEISANPYCSLLGPVETSASRLNLAQSFNGMGCALGPLIMGTYLFSEGKDETALSYPYAIMGAVVFIVALLFSRIKLPLIQKESTVSSGEAIKILIKNRDFMFGFFALLAYEVGEISLNSYFVNYATGMDWMSAREASYYLGLGLFIYMSGRFLSSWILRFIHPYNLLRLFAIGSLSCMAVIFCSGLMNFELGKASIIFILLNFLFESIMFPTIFSTAVRKLGNLTNTGASILMMTPVGGCVFLTMAIIADKTGNFTLPFIIPLCAFFFVWLYARQKWAVSQKKSKLKMKKQSE